MTEITLEEMNSGNFVRHPVTGQWSRVRKEQPVNESAALVRAGTQSLTSTELRTLHAEIANLIGSQHLSHEEMCTVAKACRAVDDLYHIRATEEMLK